MGWLRVTAVVVIACILYSAVRESGYNPDEVKGLRVVITGASSGIGEQIAYKFASMGAKLHITARRESILQKVAARAKELGAIESHYLTISLSSYENSTLAVKDALEKLGGIDVLILNHFTNNYLGSYRHEAKDIEKLFMPNMLTHAHLASVAMESLIENKGRIAATSSAVALLGGAFTVPYTTTKFALGGFFRSLEHELTINKTGVSVSLIQLGYVATNSSKAIADKIKATGASKIECASEIVRGIMTREKLIYFPGYVSWIPLMRALFPNYVDKMTREAYYEGAFD
uniref:Hydroxysteroid 11-beta-dehydrogenase 1-like protein n=1 Tax=Ciona intestinalis TaxID=7719 RepID=F6R1D9_CIOIN|nr:hydroxysteroid 11-beta-dehydrogenase 1-like protein [Ciona intestinalis]|eukprot:XP_002131037.1 hydroxysteroid 11-beta-dehydrogenase 1-like protein [Ciona intestinalis]